MGISEVSRGLVPRWSEFGTRWDGWDTTRVEQRGVCLSPAAKLWSWQEDTELVETGSPSLRLSCQGWDSAR